MAACFGDSLESPTGNDWTNDKNHSFLVSGYSSALSSFSSRKISALKSEKIRSYSESYSSSVNQSGRASSRLSRSSSNAFMRPLNSMRFSKLRFMFQFILAPSFLSSAFCSCSSSLPFPSARSWRYSICYNTPFIYPARYAARSRGGLHQ